MIATAESDAGPINEADEAAPRTPVASVPEKIMRRRPRVTEKAVRERKDLDPGACCPACGGELRLVGEDVSEILDMVAAQMKVLYTVLADQNAYQPARFSGEMQNLAAALK